VRTVQEQQSAAALVMARALAWYRRNLENGTIPGKGNWPEAQPDEVALHEACATFNEGEVE
jgi:hypothetical protein